MCKIRMEERGNLASADHHIGTTESDNPTINRSLDDHYWEASGERIVAYWSINSQFYMWYYTVYLIPIGLGFQLLLLLLGPRVDGDRWPAQLPRRWSSRSFCFFLHGSSVRRRLIVSCCVCRVIMGTWSVDRTNQSTSQVSPHLQSECVRVPSRYCIFISHTLFHPIWSEKSVYYYYILKVLCVPPMMNEQGNTRGQGRILFTYKRLFRCRRRRHVGGRNRSSDRGTVSKIIIGSVPKRTL